MSQCLRLVMDDASVRVRALTHESLVQQGEHGQHEGWACKQIVDVMEINPRPLDCVIRSIHGKLHVNCVWPLWSLVRRAMEFH